MNYFKTPKFLHDVLGEKQTFLEVVCIIAFALVGTALIYLIAKPLLLNWQTVLAFVVIGDVLAGCIANFSYGTNAYYSKSPKKRLLFISVHVHIIAIAWLMGISLIDASIIWFFTIVSAFITNHFKGKKIQVFIGANLMCYGLILAIFLSLPDWFLIVSVFFMIKVLFSFSVDHYASNS